VVESSFGTFAVAEMQRRKITNKQLILFVTSLTFASAFALLKEVEKFEEREER